MLVSIDLIDALVFDFDGVLTNNLVHVDDKGNEWVTCNRSDGLAFDALRKLNKPTFFLSTEKNLVVSARANKLRVRALIGFDDKVAGLNQIIDKGGFEFKRIFYVGNDLNDYRAMKMCGYGACPSDSHPAIKRISTHILEKKGGDGVARELLESILGLDLLEVLYPD